MTTVDEILNENDAAAWRTSGMVRIKITCNSPRSIVYESSNMTTKPSGHISINYGLVLFVLKLLLGITRQQTRKKLKFCPQTLGVMLEFLCIESGLFKLNF